LARRGAYYADPKRKRRKRVKIGYPMVYLEYLRAAMDAMYPASDYDTQIRFFPQRAVELRSTVPSRLFILAMSRIRCNKKVLPFIAR
jgi:hypothetical protein